MSLYQIAQINIGRIKGTTINDPIMKEFIDNLDTINKLAETSKGFVWRLKDDTNNATSINPYNDEQVIINVSVWETIEDLEHFIYRTFHSHFLKRRKEWFQTYGKAYAALWWIPAGKFPGIEEAVQRLDHLQRNGPSEFVFDYKNKFAMPKG